MWRSLCKVRAYVSVFVLKQDDHWLGVQTVIHGHFPGTVLIQEHPSVCCKGELLWKKALETVLPTYLCLWESHCEELEWALHCPYLLGWLWSLTCSPAYAWREEAPLWRHLDCSACMQVCETAPRVGRVIFLSRHTVQVPHEPALPQCEPAFPRRG